MLLMLKLPAMIYPQSIKYKKMPKIGIEKTKTDEIQKTQKNQLLLVITVIIIIISLYLTLVKIKIQL